MSKISINRLTNANVSDGTTLHWHGLDVPNAADGVAGVVHHGSRAHALPMPRSPRRRKESA